ncbi:hypothetical protein GIB67_017880 [Kingdonia uniflora]|uniref:Uncharacterized protein n=1 Tax=Kingdonia uniflora TaxID=39325 RepID=A0A7J7MKS1_9MAGN|nr:hypothetical protein GIB67_017880 [Kingdonia uniflora]
MTSEKVETIVVGNYIEMEPKEGNNNKGSNRSLSKLFWNGGSVYDAWFSCASNKNTFEFPNFAPNSNGRKSETLMSLIGWYGSLIDLSRASSHMGDYVQLLVFVHRTRPSFANPTNPNFTQFETPIC